MDKNTPIKLLNGHPLLHLSERQIDALDVWYRFISKRMPPRWFVTLTSADEHIDPAEFIKETKRFTRNLTRQAGEPGKVKRSVSHTLAITSFGFPTVHGCSRMHSHLVLCSERDRLREKHFQRWELGLAKASLYKPELNGFYYVARRHLFTIPSTHAYCPRSSKCRGRKGCHYRDVGFTPKTDLLPPAVFSERPQMEPCRSWVGPLTGEEIPTAECNTTYRGIVAPRTRAPRRTIIR